MKRRSILDVLLISWLTVGCAAHRSSTPDASVARAICINGLAVNGGGRAVLDVLRSDVTTRRWLATFDAGSRGPLVLIDGREADGTGRLAAIAASEVNGVEILESDRATAEFGSRGRGGALLVRTQSMSRQDPDPRLPAPERCHREHER